MTDFGYGHGVTLTVYVSKGCWACEGVAAVLARVRARVPAVAITVVDIDRAAPRDIPRAVFSVPTYTLDGTVIALGNPSDDFVDTLQARLAAAKESTL